MVAGLVVAVIDHEHVKLRLLYSRKKKLDKTVENLRNEVDELKVTADLFSFLSTAVKTHATQEHQQSHIQARTHARTHRHTHTPVSYTHLRAHETL